MIKAEGVNMSDEIYLELKDDEWPFTYTDNDRHIVRAIIVDSDNMFYFVRVERNDEFGKATLIETSGGGVEEGEDFFSSLKRELKEELGAKVDILGKIGVVSDYYNLIHRHNINNYYLCLVKSFGARHLTPYEENSFHLSTIKLSYEEAIKEYERGSNTRLGALIKNREIPILHRAKNCLKN